MTETSIAPAFLGNVATTNLVIPPPLESDGTTRPHSAEYWLSSQLAEVKRQGRDSDTLIFVIVQFADASEYAELARREARTRVERNFFQEFLPARVHLTPYDDQRVLLAALNVTKAPKR